MISCTNDFLAINLAGPPLILWAESTTKPFPPKESGVVQQRTFYKKSVVGKILVKFVKSPLLDHPWFFERKRFSCRFRPKNQGWSSKISRQKLICTWNHLQTWKLNFAGPPLILYGGNFSLSIPLKELGVVQQNSVFGFVSDFVYKWFFGDKSCWTTPDSLGGIDK